MTVRVSCHNRNVNVYLVEMGIRTIRVFVNPESFLLIRHHICCQWVLKATQCTMTTEWKKENERNKEKETPTLS